MQHRHTILRQRDSLSEDVSSQSIQSENQNFLASRNSSTRSTTVESTPNPNRNNLSSPAFTTNRKQKPMNNDRTNNHIPSDKQTITSEHNPTKHNNTKLSKPIGLPVTTLSPILSGEEVQIKLPTKQNKPSHTSDDDIEVHGSPSNDLIPALDEKDDELSGLPPARPPPRFNDKMRVESNSNLTKSPSLSKSAPSVDSSHAIKPSEVHKESHKSAKARALSDLLMDIDKKEQMERLPQLTDTISLNRGEKSKEKIKHKRKKKQKKRNKKPNKCTQWCTRTKQNYKHCQEVSAFCIRFREIQHFGRKYVTTSALFRWTILVCILLNCVFIALEDPTGDESSGRNKLVSESETIFAIIFTCEMVIKMFCNGLFGNHMPKKDQESEQEIENEIKQNKENEKQMTDREASANPINQSTESVDHGTEHKLDMIDPKQAVEMAHFGHDIPTGITHRQSISYRDPAEASASTSTWASTAQSSSLGTSRQQNDRDPKHYVGYFRDNWNLLDFIIVVTSWIEWLPIQGGSNLTAIRVLRVLRPLRTFTKIKSLKVLIATIIKSLKGLSDVLVLLLFLFVVFAIIGIQMFNGKLRQQCFSDDFRDEPRSAWCCDDPTKWVEDENFCILRTGETGNNNADNGCPSELAWCLNIAPNPNGGVTNFDNIVYAMLNVFVTISLEGWAAIQYKLEDTGCTAAWIYFVLLTFIVGFFAANLCLAVIESVYGDEMKRKHKREEKEMNKKYEDGKSELKEELKVLKQAIEETNVAWKKQKKARMMIQTEHIIHHGDTPTNADAEDATPHALVTPHAQHDEDQSFYKIDSFRLPYVTPDGDECEFRTRIVKELTQRTNPLPRTLTQSRCKSVDQSTHSHHSPTTPIPFSSHQAGLIQTSQEWNDLQLDSIHTTVDKDHDEEQVTSPSKKKVNHHKRTSSIKLKKDKRVKFSHGLGLGTQSYMHRYRTGHLPQTGGGSPVTASYSHGNLRSPMSAFTPGFTPLRTTSSRSGIKGGSLKGKLPYGTGYFSDNDATAHEDEDEDRSLSDHDPVIPTPEPHSFLNKKKSLTTEERRAKFARSRHANSGRSLSGTRRSKTLAVDLTRLDVLKKVDYKTGSTENFESAMNRVKLYVNASKKEELEQDVQEYAQIKSDENPFDQSHGDLIDDLTFGDMPLQLEMEHVHNKHHHNEQLSDELKRKQHQAKKKRKENEILARRAIIIAHTAPKWTEWVEARDAPWIDAINTLVVSSVFQSVIMLIIIANTVVLAMTWPEQDERLKDILESCNAVFTFIFILEAVLKLIGLGPRAYFADNWNKFDFIIVFVSICEMLVGVALPGTNVSGGSAISALRSMRLLRAFRLLGKFDGLKQLFMLVVASMHEVSLLTLVLAIFIFMFAALAMSLFGGKLILLGDRRSGRWRFDNFYWSWVNVFMVISGDSWNEVMYDTVKATNDKTTTIYYVIVVCFGTFVILNLFVAILLSKMGSEDSDADFMLDGLVKYSYAMWTHSVDKQDQVDRLVMSIERKKYIAQFKDKRSQWKHHRDKEAMEGKSLGIFDPHNRFRILCHRIVEWKWFEITIDLFILTNCVFLAMESPAARLTSKQMFTVADIFFTVLFVFEFLIKVIALGAFQQPFRKGRSWRRISDDDALLEWTDRSYQAVFFMHQIDPSSILDLPGLAIECIESNDGWRIVHLWGQQVLRIVYHNRSFTTAYKLVDQQHGIWEVWHSDVDKDVVDEELETVLTSFDLTDHHHNAYFASNWNRLDAVVVLVAVLGVGFENVSFLRALRAFRPFRIMVRFKKIKVVLGALLRAIPGLFNTFLFCILFWFVFSILGVNWYNGKYRHCRIEDADEWDAVCSALDIATDPLCDLCTDACVMYNLGKTQCDGYVVNGLRWTISVYNFDNVFEALHSLFVVATLSGWNFVMYEAIDSTQLNAALREDNNPSAAIYFMVVVILCSFFSLNLIVSVVVDNFNTIKAEKDGSAFQTEEQALWVNNQRLLERISLDATYTTPHACFSRLSFIIVQHDWFDPFIMLCIILNAVSMALEHYNQDETWTLALQTADVVFVMIFCLEAIFKIAAYGFTLYIINNWNKFDFIISIVGVVQLVTDSGLGLNVLRLFRVGRLLRLLHKAKTLRMLFWTLVYSIPSLWNIGLLLFVIFFIYAVIGMHILTDYVTAVDDEVNANDFWSAVSLLYRVGTEDGWTDVYQAYLEAWPEDERYKIYIYFVSFFVVGTLVLINLFIAVVLDSFEENHNSFSREDKFTIIHIWRDIWSYFEPAAKRELAVRDFIDILRLTPKSDAFCDKHKMTGPGFFDGNPFQFLMQKMMDDNVITRSRTSLSFSRSSLFSSKSNEEEECEEDTSTRRYDASMIRKINTVYDIDTKRNKLRAICPHVSHSDMIKLLLRLRLRVELHEDDSQELTCFGKLAKLVYEICNSMGVGSRAQKDELIKQHTLKKKKKNEVDLAAGVDEETLSDKEMKQLQQDLRDVIDFENPNQSKGAIHDPGFDIGNKTWYVSYDDALLALCSEVIGPRLPDGFPMFTISNETESMRIVEWYTIKHDCYDVFKKVTFDIENNKQFPAVVPSQHVSNQRQKELQQKTRASVQFKTEFKRIQNQIATNKLHKNVFQNIVEEEEKEIKHITVTVTAAATDET